MALTGALIRHRRSELASIGVLFVGNLEVFTIEARPSQLDEGVYTLRMDPSGDYARVGDTGQRIAPANRIHGESGYIGVGLAASHHCLQEGERAWHLLRAELLSHGEQALTVEIIDQSDTGDALHEDLF